MIKNHCNCVGTTTVLSQEETKPVEKPVVIPNKDEMVTEISDNILRYLKDFKPQEAPPGFENTELNDDQIAEVLNTMLKYQDTYFSETPLNSELVQAFVWNIPKDIFKTHAYVKDHCLPDVMDPIYWFYMFCMKNPEQAIGKFIAEAINSTSEEDFDEVTKCADEYDEM